MSHTPGPWEVLEVHRGEYQIGAAGQTADYDGQTVALCRIVVANWDNEPPLGQVRANAHLIAAAPDLFVACQMLEDDPGITASANEVIKYALRKARPEPQAICGGSPAPAIAEQQVAEWVSEQTPAGGK